MRNLNSIDCYLQGCFTIVTYIDNDLIYNFVNSGLESSKNLSSSAPGAISNQDQDCSLAPSNPITDSIESLRIPVSHLSFIKKLVKFIVNY